MTAHRITLAACVATALLVSGCGGSSPKADAPPRPLPSYLAHYPQNRAAAVYFIQWQRVGDSVNGTLSIVPAGGARTSARTEGLTGKLDGRNVELDVGRDPSQRWNGKLRGRMMVLTAGLEDGLAPTLVFVRANLAAFKRAVAKLEG